MKSKILTILAVLIALGLSTGCSEKPLPESGAKWIGAPWFDERGGDVTLPAPLFRKEFEAPPSLESARISISGLGYFCLYVNGERVGDDLYVPGLTDYGERPWLSESKIPVPTTIRGHRVLYLTYDISEYLREGTNTVEVLLGNGFFNSNIKDSRLAGFGSPRMICSIELSRRGGRIKRIVSDSSWMVRESEVRMNDVYMGEIYDARMDDTPWQKAVLREAPSGRLEESSCPTDKVAERIAPVSLEKQKDGTWLVDFGKTVTGRVAIEKMPGERGDTLEISYLSEVKQGPHIYVFKGDGEESHAPEFSWSVFRKCVIRSKTAPSVVAEDIHSDVGINSSFESSEPMLSKIEELFRRAQLQNMHSGFASDCPHREKLPYTGDGEVAMSAVLCNFDAESFYRKWIVDIYNSQDTESGYVPNGAPYEPNCGGGPAWGSAICIMPWEFYLRYGDSSVLNVPAMDAWVKYMLSWQKEDGTIESLRSKPGEDKPYYWYNLGDWCAPKENPSNDLVHTFYTWYCADIAAKSARALGEKDTFAEETADSLWKSFHKVFYDPSSGSYGPNGSNVFALKMGVPEERLEKVRAALAKECSDSHLHTGILGTRFLFEVLSENGMGSLALKIMTQKDFPSYGYWIAQGADTLWEQWDGGNSHNHPMFGGGLTWYYTTLAGLRADPDAPGFKHFTVKPIPVQGLKHVRYKTETHYGTVISEVDHNGSSISVSVTVPEGSTATVYCPVSVSEAEARPDYPESWTVHEVGPGEHVFRDGKEILLSNPKEFVLLSDAIPDAILEIRYYSTYNFVGKRIDGYYEPIALLTKEAAVALKKVSDYVKSKGYRLKIYDAYRPQRAVDHFIRWSKDPSDTLMKRYFYPDLAKPDLFKKGYIASKSGHSRGSTLDLTLFDMATEKEVDMGGTFDWLGPESHPDYCAPGLVFQKGGKLTEQQFKNRMILREAMVRHGFVALDEEWWHFRLRNEPYPDTYFDYPVRWIK